MALSIHELAHQCLMERDPVQKVTATQSLFAHVKADGVINREPAIASPIQISVPGKPDKPELVSPRLVKNRKLSTPEGRAGLVHAVSHIEFNAINLALDAVYRFRDMPDQYYHDWLLVAAEESKHFSLLKTRLRYGLPVW